MIVTRNVPTVIFGRGSLNEFFKSFVNENSKDIEEFIFFVDHFFYNKEELLFHSKEFIKNVFFIDTTNEPTTESVDNLTTQIKNKNNMTPKTIIGIGGGSTLDTAKAVSNLLTNPGNAEEYQGWDLLKNPGIYKIGIPTISGTGAESSRTCVMINKKKNLKLGMNSKFSLFDKLVLDSTLSRTVPREQYFYTGMDSYIHCIESLKGNYRNPLSDSYSDQVIKLSREIFHGNEDMMSDNNREKLMVASYLGGCAIANSYVGLVHPFSAGLSMVLGIHHCLANCLVLNVMDEFYPAEVSEFRQFLKANDIMLPQRIVGDLNIDQLEKLYLSTIIHEKPLTNALGENFKDLLNYDKVTSIFKKI